MDEALHTAPRHLAVRGEAPRLRREAAEPPGGRAKYVWPGSDSLQELLRPPPSHFLKIGLVSENGTGGGISGLC